MPHENSHELNLIPLPQKIVLRDGRFTLSAMTPIVAEGDGSKGAADFLRSQLASLADKSTSIVPSAQKGAIRLVASTTNHGSEGYELSIEPAGMTIAASAPAGWFYGVQTLLQLLPNTGAGPADLPCVQIVDEPRFSWRGLMLDVSRHMMPVDGILRLLDNMAAHKLNSFHWHLTDDQGWRIQSQRYPRLTEIGAWRGGADGVLTPGNMPEQPPGPGRYGGFYTHDDVKRIVAHAAKLHIRVVPEIEMPGHAVAAIAAYPYLSCTGATMEPAVRTGVFPDVYCAGNEATFEFLQGVLEEILPLFPGEYVHVGGDECPKDRWKTCPKCQARIRSQGLKDEHELQSYVIRRIDKFLSGHHKRLLGWDEILEGGLAPGATVMSWRGTEGGIAAARAGHDVVMTPNKFCYLDYRQAAEGEPTAIAHGLLPLEKTYSYDPIPTELTDEQAKHILGLQGNVWTEYMPDMRHVEYMIWPRAAAIAEIGWSGTAKKDFDDFRRRAQKNQGRLTASGSTFRKIL